MEAASAVRVTNLTKTFKLYAKRSDRVKEAVHPLRRKYHRPFHALEDVSFDIRAGETFGILGPNGSGKSTLLQIIAGVLQPSAGRVEINGEVAALLELGTGFNPEYTGRQNIFINGAILGLSRDTIQHRMPDIVDFADIGPFIDQPVKTYSSGMIVRLAFAIASNVDPDILVVDEALAVGDLYFQHKCMHRMRSMMEAGTTVVLVSHDLNAVRALCRRAILLLDGHVHTIGPADEVATAYFYQTVIGQADIPVPAGENLAGGGPEGPAAGIGAGEDGRASASDPGLAATVPAHAAAGSGGSHAPVAHQGAESSAVPGQAWAAAGAGELQSSAASGHADSCGGAGHAHAGAPHRDGGRMSAVTAAPAVFSDSPEFIERTSSLRHGNGRARIRNTQLLDAAGQPIQECLFEQAVTVRVHIRFEADCPHPNIGFLLRDRNGIEIMGSNLFCEGVETPLYSAGQTLVVDFAFRNRLQSGSYSIAPAVARSDTIGERVLELYDMVENAVVFTSATGRRVVHGKVAVAMDIAVHQAS